MKYCWYRSLLSHEEQQVYDELYCGWIKGFERLTFKCSLQCVRSMPHIISAVLSDNPEIFYVSPKNVQLMYLDHKSIICTKYLYPDNERLNITKQIQKISVSIKSKYNNFSVIDRFSAIHNSIIRNIMYQQYDIKTEDHTIVGGLINHFAVCDGFSSVLKLFCDILDIPCVIVNGKATSELQIQNDNHAWNMVNINGEWIHCDITWDSLSSLDKTYSFAYSFVNDNTMSANHIWDKDRYPRSLFSSDTFFQKIVKSITINDLLYEMLQIINYGKVDYNIRFTQKLTPKEVGLLINKNINSLPPNKGKYLWKHIFVEETNTLIFSSPERI